VKYVRRFPRCRGGKLHCLRTTYPNCRPYTTEIRSLIDFSSRSIGGNTFNASSSKSTPVVPYTRETLIIPIITTLAQLLLSPTGRMALPGVRLFEAKTQIHVAHFGLESVVNYTIFVPLTVHSGKYARQLLEMALKLGLEPTPLPIHTSTFRKLSLYLPTILTAQIEAYPSSLSRSDLIRGLVSAAI
jgi:hypothetical protein